MLCRLLLQCGKLFFEFFLLPLVLRHEVVYACPRNPAAVPNIFLPTPSPLFLMLIVYKVMLPLWEHCLRKFQSFFYWLERWKPFLIRITSTACVGYTESHACKTAKYQTVKCIFYSSHHKKSVSDRNYITFYRYTNMWFSYIMIKASKELIKKNNHNI